MKWISKLIGIVGILSLVCVTGCSTTKYTEEKDYSRCSATSQNDMAEIETGFFHEYNNILYYADKNDMDIWVPVCNKPDCIHASEEMTCNAYLPFGDFVEKDGKLYGVASMADGRPFVYETAIDFKWIFVTDRLVKHALENGWRGTRTINSSRRGIT